MNKFVTVGTVFAALALTSFVERGAVSGKNLSEGCLAPKIEIENLDIEQVKGKKVLVSFWAAYDAQSRVNNSLLAANAKDFSEEIRMVSVSYDTDSILFKETVKLDNLDENTQYFDRNGKHSDTFRAFRLKDGFANYLLDERGVIIARNLDPKKLNDLMRRN